MIPQLQQEAPTSYSASAPQWSTATKIGFRFAFSYFLLYVYPRPVGSLGASVVYGNPLRDMWHAVVPWVGTHVLHLTGDLTEVANGSGDQLYDYVLWFCIAVVAALATVIWSALDRKRRNYEQLYQWMRVFVRMVVAVAMIVYGADKLWRMQFPEPGLARYIDSFGRTSPMGLLWATMGTSRAYSFFGGIGEMLGGLLLLIPRFTALGALVTGAVMTNVLMLNFAYDVPRKIYSIHLIAFCLFLLIPDMRRIAEFFLLNRRTQLTPPVPLFRDKAMNYGVLALQALIGVGALAIMCPQAYKDQVKNEARISGAVRGIWSVDRFSLDEIPRPPLVTDAERWQNVVFDRPDAIVIQTMDGAQKRYYLQLDPATKKFSLWNPPDTHRNASFSYEAPAPDRMTLEGQFGGRHISAELQRVNLSDPERFLLLNRGVHWVNQFPQNR
jgi:uncharacterized membrane protein YphA (DoxX/SURF4 family)